MPRGLGEDPLSRKRRIGAARAAAVAGPPVVAVAIPESAPIPQPTSPPDSSSSFSVPPGPSYNEVFFRKRPDAIFASTGEPAAVAQVEAAVPMPAAEAAAVTIETSPAHPTENQTEPREEAGQTGSAQVQEAPEQAPAPVAQPQSERSEPQTEAKKSGLFSRLFGRLRR